MKQSIYKFNRPREFLDQVLNDRQSRNPRFSLRAWAKQLGFANPSLLSEVLRGKRNLRVPLARKIGENLKLGDSELRYFELLVMLESAKDPAERELYHHLIHKMRPKNPFHVIAIDQFRMISDWHHLAILAMVGLKDFEASPQWIAKKLNQEISPGLAQEAIERLVRLGLLEATSAGSLKKSSSRPVAIQTPVPSRAIQTHHAQMIERGLLALKEQPMAERDITGSTLCLKAKDAALIIKKIQALHQEALSLAVDHGGETVYQLNVQFFKHVKSTQAKGSPL
jgi:uncharacterized protein (TIGR02147 family)